MNLGPDISTSDSTLVVCCSFVFPPLSIWKCIISVQHFGARSLHFCHASADLGIKSSQDQLPAELCPTCDSTKICCKAKLLHPQLLRSAFIDGASQASGWEQGGGDARDRGLGNDVLPEKIKAELCQRCRTPIPIIVSIQSLTTNLPLSCSCPSKPAE